MMFIARQYLREMLKYSIYIIKVRVLSKTEPRVFVFNRKDIWDLLSKQLNNIPSSGVKNLRTPMRDELNRRINNMETEKKYLHLILYPGFVSVPEDSVEYITWGISAKDEGAKETLHLKSGKTMSEEEKLRDHGNYTKAD